MAKLSIGLPVYNGEKYLDEALNSLLLQNFKDFELIISDNGSTDNTEEICRRYAKFDDRIRYYRAEQNYGAAWNYNQVFKLASGKYFKWATHDDVCLPGFLAKCVELLDTSSSSVVLVYTQTKFIDADGKVLNDDKDVLETRHAEPYRRLAHILNNLNMANAIFGLIRSDALRKTRLIDSFIASDYVLLAELAILGEYLEIKQPLYLRRIHRDASRYANQSNKEVLSWFDPSKKSGTSISNLLFPRLIVRARLLLEWMRSVYTIPLSRKERILCLMTVPTAYGASRIRCYMGMWKRRIGRMFARFSLR